MKQCPACKTTYTDDSLSFCLADGTPLTAIRDEEPTVVRDNLRIDIPSESSPRSTPPTASSSGTSSGKWVKISVVTLLLGILLFTIAVVFGFVFYYNSGSPNTNVDSKTPIPTATPTATPDNEKQRLQDELANLQKKVADQKKTSVNTIGNGSDVGNGWVIATANSPGDGFLALRSEPDTETGTRITKIPHGDRLEIGVCGVYMTTSRNNRGRWCRARYNGYSGWVFDAFIKY